MTSFEGVNVIAIQKFNEENFNVWKFNLEMELAFVDLWDIVHKSEGNPLSNVDHKMKKNYRKRAKKTMSIIVFNLAHNQLMHSESCKGSSEAWMMFCNIHP